MDWTCYALNHLAAREISAADPTLLPALMKLRDGLDPDDGYWVGCLDDAIAACSDG